MHPLVNSFRYAVKGIVTAVKEQRNIRIQVASALCVIALGFLFSIERWEWCVALLTIGLVIAAEMANSAIESLVDLVQPAYHPLAGKVKDLAAGAVLVTAITAIVTGLLVFGRHVALLFP